MLCLTMMDIQKLLDCAIKLERENCVVYGVYEHANSQLGIKRFIQGIMQESRSHCKKLEAFLMEARALQESFVQPAEGVFELECSDERNLSFDALLTNAMLYKQIIERGRRLSEIYARLAEYSRDEGDRHFFRSLADDEIRHVSWAQDHLDLESMLTLP